MEAVQYDFFEVFKIYQNALWAFFAGNRLFKRAHSKLMHLFGATADPYFAQWLMVPNPAVDLDEKIKLVYSK